MLKRLRMVLAQVKSGNTSENILDDIPSNNIFFLMIKEVYNVIMNSMQL